MKRKRAVIIQAKRDDPATQRKLADRRISVIVDSFHGVDWWKKCKKFPVFTVYYNPTDFPGKYVVRLFDGPQPTRLMAIADTLEAIRKTIPPLFHCIPRDTKDDKIIVETWL